MVSPKRSGSEEGSDMPDRVLIQRLWFEGWGSVLRGCLRVGERKREDGVRRRDGTWSIGGGRAHHHTCTQRDPSLPPSCLNQLKVWRF